MMAPRPPRARWGATAAAATAALALLLLGGILGGRPGRPAMKVLVFGANGWIGKQVCETLESHHIPVVKAQSKPGKGPDGDVAAEVATVQPTHVVSVLGRTHGPGAPTIDYLEGGPDKLLINLRDNLYAPLLLARLCEQAKIHFTYFGTGCIFKYDDTHTADGVPVTEDDVPNFFGSSYSVAKGFTDRLLHHFGATALNLRIRMPFNDDDHPRNFITKLAKYSTVIDVPNSITYLPNALEVLVRLLRERRTGTLNLVNPGTVGHREVLDLYRTIVNASHRVAIVTPEQQRRRLAADRSNTHLSTDRLQDWAPGMLPVREALRRAMLGIRQARQRRAGPGVPA